MTGRPILEIKEALRGGRQEFACTALTVGPDEAVLLYRLRSAGRVADLDLPAGTLSLGYFWTARPYNAYHWLTPGGRTLGLYVNIAGRTRITPAAVSWRDLVLDLLATPGGRCRLLDEDELPADLDATTRATIAAASAEALRDHTGLLTEIEGRSVPLLHAAGIGG